MGSSCSTEDCSKHCPDGTKADIEELTRQYNNLQLSYEAAVNNKTTCFDEKAQLNTDNTNLKAEIEKLNETIENQENSLKTFESVKQERDTLKADYDALKKEYDKLKESKSNLFSAILTPKESKSDPNSDIAKLKENNAKIKKAVIDKTDHLINKIAIIPPNNWSGYGFGLTTKKVVNNYATERNKEVDAKANEIKNEINKLETFVTGSDEISGACLIIFIVFAICAFLLLYALIRTNSPKNHVEIEDDLLLIDSNP